VAAGLVWFADFAMALAWVLSTGMVVVIVILYAVSLDIDRAAADGRLVLTGWVSSGTADAGRQILIAIAAAVITVAGVVFSITILVLQLASQQFGPRMLRNFIRDRGTQISLGAFAAMTAVAQPCIR
jgi:uncharacterized membrane protein